MKRRPHITCLTMPESQDKSPKQGDSPSAASYKNTLFQPHSVSTNNTAASYKTSPSASSYNTTLFPPLFVSTNTSASYKTTLLPSNSVSTSNTTASYKTSLFPPLPVSTHTKKTTLLAPLSISTNSTIAISPSPSPSPSIRKTSDLLKVLKSVVIRKRAKKEAELKRKLQQQEEEQQSKRQRLTFQNQNYPGIVTSASFPPSLSPPGYIISSKAGDNRGGNPPVVPKKRARRAATPRWEDTPQLINFSLPGGAPPLLPPIETFNILSSVQEAAGQAIAAVPDTPPPNLWPFYNGAKALDSDTLNFIHRIYCRECRMEEQRRSEGPGEEGGPGGEQGGGGDQPISPLMMAVEEQSLQMSMETNKESLKRKLMFRRSIPELVDQGIYPPLKTPPAFAEQRTKLERAKTGDFLRHKLQSRPERAELVEHHILEDTTVDPSLQERQRQLKRARLQDSLSERLINRPGPLELVERNILPIDPEFENAIQEGIISFPKTSDIDDPHRRHYTSESEDGSLWGGEAADSPGGGSSDGGASSTAGGAPSTSSAYSVSSASSGVVPAAPDITPLLQKFQHIGSEIKTCTFSQTTGSQVYTQVPGAQTFTLSSAGGGLLTSVGGGLLMGLNRSGLSFSSNKAKKKKAVTSSRPLSSKSRVIKFHEYKGPPSAVRSGSSGSQQPSPGSISLPPTPPPPSLTPLGTPLPPGAPGSDSPYNVMLQQQQLLLQWQLEVQQKSLPFLVPTNMLSPDQMHLSQFSPGSSMSSPGSVGAFTPATTPQPVRTPTPGGMYPGTPGTPPRAPTPLTPGLRSAAGTPSPANYFQGSAAGTPSPATYIQVPLASPAFSAPSPVGSLILSPPSSVPPPPPPPPLPPATKPAAASITIPKTVPVVLAASNASSIAVATIGTPISAVSFPPRNLSGTEISQPTALKIITNNTANNTTTTVLVTNPNNGTQPNKITKLEDLKVTDLKQECKKRSLPVSGPKPNLLNKLAPYSEEIVKEYQEKQSQLAALTAAQNTLNAVTAAAKNVKSPPAKSPPGSASSTGSMGSVFAGLTNDDATMMPISPPSSPSNGGGIMDLNASIASVMATPLSPEESMDMSGPVHPVLAPPPPVQPSVAPRPLTPPILPTTAIIINPNKQLIKATQPATSGITHPSITPLSISSTAPTSIAFTKSLSHPGGTPMLVDPTSRPPSVTPMDMDVMESAHSMAPLGLPTITPGQLLQTATSLGAVTTSLAGTPLTVSVTRVPSTHTQVVSGFQPHPLLHHTPHPQPHKMGAIQFARPAAAPRPMQIQIAPTHGQFAATQRPHTTFIRPAGSGGQAGVTQIHIPMSQIQPPIKVPIQAKVHLPPGPIQFPSAGGGLGGGSGAGCPGQIAVPVTGSLPMSAEVSIPVSGGTIQIPVSQLPPHLQQQVSIQIQQQLQQQALAAVAKKTGATSLVINKGIPTAKLSTITGKMLGPGGNNKTTTTTLITGLAPQIPTGGKTLQNGGIMSSGATTTLKLNNGKALASLSNNNNRVKAIAGKPRVTKGKGKNVKNGNNNGGGDVSKSIIIATATATNSISPPVSAETSLIWQQGQPQVLDIVNDPHPVAADSGRMDMDIKQEKPGSPPDAMQTGDDRMGSPPGIKTEPVPSPLGSGVAGGAGPRMVTNDDLVQEQQRQIEELRNQLLLSQSKLQEAQTQTQLHQEQLRKLTLAKLASLTQQNTLNVLLAEQAKTQAQIQILTSAQNEQLTQLAQQNILSPNSNSTAVSSAPQPAQSQMSLIQTSPGLQTAAASHPTTTTATSEASPPPSTGGKPLLGVSAAQTVTSSALSATVGAGGGGGFGEKTGGNLTSLLQQQGLHRIDLSQTKLVQVINAAGQPQFVLTSQPSSKPSTVLTSAGGGTSTEVTHSKAQSVPSSPPAQSKLQRSATNPLFVPTSTDPGSLKSPPNYDEAMKNKQSIMLTGGQIGDDGKYTQMDDVLDVLIQSGELPPSAAQEPPPTPKTTAGGVSSAGATAPSQPPAGTGPMTGQVLQGTTITIPASSVVFSNSSSQFVVPAGDIFSNPTNGLVLTSSALVTPIATPSLSPGPPNSVSSNHSSNHSNSNAFMSGNNSTVVPSPCSSTASDSHNAISPASNHDNHMEFQMGDHLSTALSDLPLLDMEWTNTDFLSSPNFCISNEIGESKKDMHLFTPPLSTCSATTASPGSSHYLTSTGEHKLLDMGSIDHHHHTEMNVDVSDWLDAIMPSSGLTANAPTTFSGDPILTPKPQDVLDLFNMDDTDLCAGANAGHTHLGSLVSNFDKAMESASSAN